MKIQSFAKGLWLGCLGGAIAALFPFMAAVAEVNSNLFGARDLATEDVVAIAVPIDGGKAYNLLILEQLSNSRDCWQEQRQGNGVTVIDPLLLKFDFTNICGRSTDSNGYSLRLAGEEMAWRYNLRVVQEGNDLKLKAFNDNPWRSPLEVGHTKGMAGGMLKIHLHAGWRLAKRTYGGQALGHIYIVNDQSVNQLVAAAAPNPVQPMTTSLTAAPRTSPSSAPVGSVQLFVPPPQQAPQTGEIALSVTVPAPPTPTGNLSELGILPVPSARIPANNANKQLPPPPLSTSLAVALGLKYRVVVDAPTSTDQEVVKNIVPDAFNTWIGDRRMLQVGVYADETEAQAMRNRLSQSGFNAQIVPVR